MDFPVQGDPRNCGIRHYGVSIGSKNSHQLTRLFEGESMYVIVTISINQAKNFVATHDVVAVDKPLLHLPNCIGGFIGLRGRFVRRRLEPLVREDARSGYGAIITKIGLKAHNKD